LKPLPRAWGAVGRAHKQRRFRVHVYLALGVLAGSRFANSCFLGQELQLCFASLKLPAVAAAVTPQDASAARAGPVSYNPSGPRAVAVTPQDTSARAPPISYNPIAFRTCVLAVDARTAGSGELPHTPVLPRPRTPAVSASLDPSPHTPVPSGLRPRTPA
jgi:hypothetical protein